MRSQGSQLHLSDAKRSDAALYKCVATNPAGKDEITFTLEVQGKSGSVQQLLDYSESVLQSCILLICRHLHLICLVFPSLAVPAYIELSTPDKTPEVVLGRRLSMFCMPKGNPEPSIKWLKDNQPINPSRVMLRNGDKELIINTTTEGDSGRYTCRASNTIGMDSENFDVSITCE